MFERNILPFLCLLVISIPSFSQSLNPTVQSYSPPSPAAASISKFGDIPVGTSTGIPSISIPIYTYSHSRLGVAVPISLNYHGGGIRVDDLPGPVGSGWTLTCGGVITRNMRGVYDEMTNGGFLNSPALPTNELDGNSPSDVSMRPFNDMNAYELDSQNDIFSYNFPGKSGKFVFGKDGSTFLLNGQKISVERVLGQLSGSPQIYKAINAFIITDENGLKYVFSDAEITFNHSLPNIPGKYTSSWFLSNIQTPTGQVLVTFNYEDTDYQYLTGRHFSETVRMPGIAGLPPGLPYSASTASHRIVGKRLKSVEFKNGVIVTLNYSNTEQIDPNQSSINRGDFLLKEIELSSNISVRGFRLEHDYSTNRPTLRKLIPYGGIEKNEEAPYEFFYEAPLPDRLSSQQDHWGFYNSNDGGLIPSEVIEVGINGNYGQYHQLPGGNRNTDPLRCRAGSLKQIHYPTGGYTEFEMEANTAVDPRLNNQISFISEIYSYEGQKTVYCTSSETTATTFDFAGDPNTNSEITIRIPSSSGITCNATSCKLYVEIKTLTDQLVEARSFDPPVGSSAAEHKFNVGTMIPGTYKIITYTSGLNNYFTYLDFRWKESRIQNPIAVPVTIGSNQLYVGGLRVKTISDYLDGYAQPESTREYSYVLDDNVTSSGTLGFYPVYSNKVCYLWGQTLFGSEIYDGGCNSPNYISRSSSTIHPMMYSSGSPVSYKRVIEKKKGRDGEYLGRTEYYFKSFHDVPAIILKPFPFSPPEYKEWLNGLLDSLEIYGNDGLVKKHTYVYQNYDDPYWNDPVRMENLRSVSIAPVKYRQEPSWSEPRYFKANNFYPTAGRADLIKVVTTDYYSTGSTTTEEIRTLHPDYFFLRSAETKSSDGRAIKRKILYPKDKVDSSEDPTGVYRAMIDNNHLNAVVEEKKEVSGVQTESIKAFYGTPHPSLYVPLSVESTIENGPLKSTVNYHEYDIYGNPVAVSKERDLIKTFIWSPNGHFLDAEVQNATSNQVYFNSFEYGDGTSSNGDCHSGNKSRTNGFYKLLTDLPNGEYVLSYWSKDIDGWQYNRSNINVTASSYAINIAGQIDDIRFYPKNAFITTYTYDPLTGPTSITDSNDVIIFYEYDVFGRLKKVRDHNKHLLQEHTYHYKN